MFAILHRKNSLLHKTKRAAYVTDLFISLIYTCQLSGVKPFDYLTWLLKNTNPLQPSPYTSIPWSLPGSKPLILHLPAGRLGSPGLHFILAR